MNWYHGLPRYRASSSASSEIHWGTVSDLASRVAIAWVCSPTATSVTRGSVTYRCIRVNSASRSSAPDAPEKPSDSSAM